MKNDLTVAANCVMLGSGICGSGVPILPWSVAWIRTRNDATDQMITPQNLSMSSLAGQFRSQRAVSSSRTSRHSVTSALINNGPSSNLSDKTNPYSPAREFSGHRTEWLISVRGIRPGLNVRRISKMWEYVPVVDL
jgi:hypothetical protein